MNGLTFFDELARPGARFLEYLGGTPEERRYLDLVAQIARVLSGIHGRVADVTVRVGEARTMAEASMILKGLEQSKLQADMKARALCDRLERLGRRMRSVLPQESAQDVNTQAWYRLAQDLEGREYRTAELYEQQLYDLRMLPQTEPSLESVKAKASEALDSLISQKAGFDLLEKKARARRERLR